MFLTTGDETKGNEELASLAENFREQAAVLVDMLDISIPMVAKLKVKTVKVAVFTVRLLKCILCFFSVAVLFFFTARAILARSWEILSVHPSVCLSVTHVLCD